MTPARPGAQRVKEPSHVPQLPSHNPGVLVSILMFALAVHCPGAAQSDRLPRRMPDSLPTLISVPDYPGLIRKLAESPLAAAPDGSPGRRLLDAARDALHPRLRAFFKAAGMTPERLAALKPGAAALGLRLAGDGNQHLRGLLLLDARESRREARSLLEDARRTAGSLEWLSVEERVLADRRVDCFTVSGGDAEGPVPGRFYALLDQGTLAVVGDTDDQFIKSYLRQYEPDSTKTLGGSELYRETTDYLDERGDVMVFTGRGGSNPDGPRTRWLRRMGLMDVRGSARAIRLGEEGIHTRSVHLLPRPRRGLMKALTTGTSRPEPAGYVSGDPVFYGGLRFDPATLWTEVMSALEDFAPSTADSVRERVKSGILPVNLERDLLGALGSNWQLYVPKPAVGEGMPRMIHAALAVELDHPGEMRKALEAWLQPGSGDRGVTKIHHVGATIYSMDTEVPLGMLPVSMPSLQPEEDGGGGRPMRAVRPSVSLLEDRVVLASSLELAKKVAEQSRRGASPLMERPAVQDMLSRLMPDRDGLLIADAREVGAGLWAYARGLVRRHSGGEVSLPPFSTMQGHLGMAAAAIRWSDRGAAIETWLPYADVSQEGGL